MQPRKPIVSITSQEDGSVIYHRYDRRPVVPRYTIGQTIVVTLAGLAVGSFLAWVIVSAACRALEWAWS